ncbi:MAG: hypothetical protein KQH59_18245 [Desulfobulbaceae bacterium]|nr:hypothetical protein [Desulfobulbaceae bacterium]
MAAINEKATKRIVFTTYQCRLGSYDVAERFHLIRHPRTGEVINEELIGVTVSSNGWMTQQQAEELAGLFAGNGVQAPQWLNGDPVFELNGHALRDWLFDLEKEITMLGETMDVNEKRKVIIDGEEYVKKSDAEEKIKDVVDLLALFDDLCDGGSRLYDCLTKFFNTKEDLDIAIMYLFAELIERKKVIVSRYYRRDLEWDSDFVACEDATLILDDGEAPPNSVADYCTKIVLNKKQLVDE